MYPFITGTRFRHCLLITAAFGFATLQAHASGVAYSIATGIAEGNGKDAGIHAIALDGQGNILGSNIRYQGTTRQESLFTYGSSGYSTAFQFDPVSTVKGPRKGTNTDGSGVDSLVLAADGAFYGAAQAGGKNADGTLFKFAPGGGFTVLHNFNKRRDGSHPTCLVSDGLGNFYGTTATGGAGSSGTVFRLAADGTVTTLHAFAQVANSTPQPPPAPGCPTLGSDGNLYGVVYLPGQSPLDPNTLLFPTNLYKLTPDGSYSVVSTFILTEVFFKGVGIAGEVPAPWLALGSDGALYGVLAVDGGQTNSRMFRLNADGSIKRFAASLPPLPVGSGGNEAQMPLPLLADPHGNFFGTVNSELNGAVTGTVFSASTDGSSVPALYGFAYSTWSGSNANSLYFDGYAPTAWTFDGSGNLIVASNGFNHSASIVRIVPDGDMDVSMTNGGITTVKQGQNVDLSWSTTGASQCAFVGSLPNESGIMGGTQPLSGELSVAATHSLDFGSWVGINFGLQCSDSQGGINRSSLYLQITV